MESTGSPSASDALDLIADTRADLADRLATPWWFYPVHAVLNAGLVLAVSVESLAVIAAVLVVYCGGMYGLLVVHRRRSGTRSMGTDDRLFSPVAVVGMIAIVASVLTGADDGRLSFSPGPFVAAAAMFAAVVLNGLRSERRMRSRLRTGR